MKQSSKRFASMILSLVLLVAAFMVFFDLIQPTYGNLQTEKGTEVSTQALLASEGQIISEAKSLVSQYDNGGAAQANLALAMPSGPDAAGALAQIYGFAQNSDLTVDSVQLSPPQIQVEVTPTDPDTTLTLSEITKPVGTFTLTLNAFGSYEDFKSFLSALETNIRIFDVTTLSIQAANAAPVVTNGKTTTENAAPVDFFTYTVGVTTYYQSP